MSGPDRNYSFNRNDESSLQQGYQPYQGTAPPHYDQRDLSPVEGNAPQYPAAIQNMSSPPPPPMHRNPVGMHPDSAFNQMQNQRQHGADGGSTSRNYTDYSPPGITPGADNLGEAAAGGGINGIAIGVANSNERQSGVQALQDINNWGRNGHGAAAGPRAVPPEREQQDTPFADQYGYDHPMPPRPIHSQPSYGSNAPLAAGAMTPGLISHNNSAQSIPLGTRSTPPAGVPYTDNPYNRYSSSNLNLAPQMGQIDPNDLADDDDWGMGPQGAQQQKRRSFVPFAGSSRDGSREGLPGTAAAAVGAGAGTAAYLGTRDASGNYTAVPQGSLPESQNEKSAWLKGQNSGRKRLTIIVGSVIALLVIGAIVGGVLGAVLSKKGGDGSAAKNQQSVQEDNKTPLNKDSGEIQKLMNNNALHKVFPGMDYTPLNTQYPDCLTSPPSQNNVTRDMAVLSQLTPAVRLYGTDCNQTEMVLHAIDELGLTDMKVWLGVWLGNNHTTNVRQIDQMWTILNDNKDKATDLFKGIIVGNEVLYRKDLTSTQLLGNITEIKSNLTKLGFHDLPIATSDLGDNWTADMATKVDIVMSNVHPFFAGVEVDKAAGWTWDFWTGHDVALTANNASIKQIIAEVGWPSEGGNDCGAATCTSDTQGSIASIDNMNKFMEDWSTLR